MRVRSPTEALHGISALSEPLHLIFEVVRAWAAYLAFTATLATSLVLILKRDFMGAAWAALADLFEFAEEIRRHAQAVVNFWSAHVTGPVHEIILGLVAFDIPVWAIDVLTLVIFALGPVVRAVWTERARRGNIRKRLETLDSLSEVRDEQARQIEVDEAARHELQEALRNEDWDRVKAGLRVLGGLALGALSALNFNLQHAGASVKGAQQAYKEMSDGSDRWKAVTERVTLLNQVIASRTEELQALERRIENLLSADDGLLRSLEGKAPNVVRAGIRQHVAERMKLALLLSRISMGLVGAVVGAHLIDWVL